MRGRWHGGAVTDEVEALASTRRCPPHQSPLATASPHRGSHWSAFPKASPPRGGGSAKPRRRGRRKFAATSQSPSVTAPLEGEPFPRKKVTSIWISNAPSIDGRCSTETSCKFGTPVSGGAYQNARKVTIEWNARPKHRDLPEFRGRTHQTRPSAPFLPYLFPRKGKDRAAGGASETTTTERILASKASYPLCSFFPFQTASETCGLGFSMQICSNLSVSLRLTAPLKGEPFGVLDSLAILKSGTNHRRYVL